MWPPRRRIARACRDDHLPTEWLRRDAEDGAALYGSQAPRGWPQSARLVTWRWFMAAQRGWFKSSFSDHGGNCVAVRFAGNCAYVRDDKFADGPVLMFRRGEWEAFLLGAFNGEFEMPL